MICSPTPWIRATVRPTIGDWLGIGGMVQVAFGQQLLNPLRMFEDLFRQEMAVGEYRDQVSESVRLSCDARARTSSQR